MSKTSIIVLSALATLVVVPEAAIAAKFDVEAGVAAATEPIIKMLNNHWGKIIISASAIGLFFSKRDRNSKNNNIKKG
jgi:hypothetical protein